MSKRTAILVFALLLIIGLYRVVSPILSHPLQQSNRTMKGDLLPQPSRKGDLLPQPQYPVLWSLWTLEAHCRRV